MDKPEFRVERGPETEPEPFAIGMAKLLEREGRTVAAAELRRLHQFAEDQIGRATAAEAALQMTKATHALKIAAVETQRDALLEALRFIAEHDLRGTSIEVAGHMSHAFVGRARAAVEAVEEGK